MQSGQSRIRDMSNGNAIAARLRTRRVHVTRPTDSDGKSKTASGADAAHYPEQDEVDGAEAFTEQPSDSHRIERRAYELWMQRGCSDGSAERDWFDAEEELRAKMNSEKVRNRTTISGSVQR
jgi:hypothetical protein